MRRKIKQLFDAGHDKRWTEDFSGQEYEQKWFVPEKFANLMIAEAVTAVGAMALDGKDCEFTADQLGRIQQQIKDWFEDR